MFLPIYILYVYIHFMILNRASCKTVLSDIVTLYKYISINK